MTAPRSVLCVGQLVADVVVRPVDSLPVPGRTSLVEELELVAGGCAANTACVLGKLGADTRVGGLAGRDPMGDLVLGEIARCGVDVSGVVRSESVPTSAVIVLVDPEGERSFLYRPGGSEALTCDMVIGGLRGGVDFVHIGGTMKLSSLDLVAFLDAARSVGCVTSLDTDWDVSGSWLRRLGPALGRVDYLMTNQDEGRELTGLEKPEDIARRLLAEGPRAVVVKCGASGAVAAMGQTVQDFPACSVQVVDTTCAGDAFAAGFLFALTMDWPLERAVRFANAAGALTTTQISHRAVTSLPAVLELLGSR